MPKITRTLGSGMTQRGIVEFDWADPGEVQAQIRAAIETFDRSSFQRLSRRLTALASAILDEADLPSDPEKQYLFSPEAGWAVIEPDMDMGPEPADAQLSFSRVMTMYQVPPDSPEGYAARVLLLLQRAQDQLQAGVTDDAMATSFAAGELVNEAAMKGVFERDFLTGEKVRAGGQKGHVQHYGTQAKKDAKRQGYLEAFDQERAKGTGITEAYNLVAARFGVSSKTIQRAVVRRKT